MSGISTHILDTSKGRPAPGVAVVLERMHGQGWETIAQGQTDQDGRCRPPLDAEQVQAGKHRLTFAVAPYFAAQKLETLYPEIAVIFSVAEGERNFHLPLLLTPHSYTTYRGT